jgi:hypothetical protein
MDFGPILDKILKVIPQERTTYLFSATMTTKVAKLQRASLSNPVRVEVNEKCVHLRTYAGQRSQPNLFTGTLPYRHCCNTTSSYPSLKKMSIWYTLPTPWRKIRSLYSQELYMIVRGVALQYAVLEETHKMRLAIDWRSYYGLWVSLPSHCTGR